MNGVKQSSREQLIILSENNDYEVYLEDAAGNQSNILNFTIKREEPRVANEPPKTISVFSYIAFIVIVGLLAWGTYVFLRKGAEREREFFN